MLYYETFQSQLIIVVLLYYNFNFILCSIILFLIILFNDCCYIVVVSINLKYELHYNISSNKVFPILRNGFFFSLVHSNMGSWIQFIFSSSFMRVFMWSMWVTALFNFHLVNFSFFFLFFSFERKLVFII